MTECSSVGRAIDCSIAYCVSVFSEINWSLVQFRPLGFYLNGFGLHVAFVSFYLCKTCLLVSGQEAVSLSVL